MVMAVMARVVVIKTVVVEIMIWGHCWGGTNLAIHFSSKSNCLEFSSQSGPRNVNRENKNFWPRGRLLLEGPITTRPKLHAALPGAGGKKRERQTHTSLYRKSGTGTRALEKKDSDLQGILQSSEQ